MDEQVRVSESHVLRADTNAAASAQIDVTREGLARVAAGDDTVGIHLNRGTDITPRIDAAGIPADGFATRGPEGRGLNESLRATTADLNQIAQEAIDAAAAP